MSLRDSFHQELDIDRRNTCSMNPELQVGCLRMILERLGMFSAKSRSPIRDVLSMLLDNSPDTPLLLEQSRLGNTLSNSPTNIVAQVLLP